ncbi:O-succinylhomoserine sulfhydrylase [Parvularcula sp. LCG005]|uniref:O-succinylhomoserine sulfhydrylase n=1 Tax=Parvularcula sp. LCG005 TaxID=3078805 RepID=UPI0029432AFF|nr:O-succinylhomoserine sulfhydrylase [Parvularcula sp. LCG005]WOI52879.1 O-succinylhomoserine sulfhydrylase [Parvularcula sp. LCG005]
MTERSDTKKWGPRTNAVRAGTNRAFQETSEGLFLTSGYAYDSPDQAAARFAGEDKGYIYSRFSNPTVEMFENRLAAIEGAEWCMAAATGMAAVSSVFMCHLKPGDHIVSSRALFGSCRYVADDLCSRFNIEADFIDGTDLDAWKRAVRPETKLFFLETPSNPGLEVMDVQAIADIAHNCGAKLLVDNVFATPILQHPFELGADLVVYSATKHMDGQGRVMGGAILGNDVEWRDEFLRPFMRNTGPSLSPFNAWVLLKSLETLDLRVRAMAQNALEVAEALSPHIGHPLARVLYPFRHDHKQVDIAKRQMEGGGTVVTLDFAGDDETAQDRAFQFLRALELIDVSNNLGDAKSLATHNRTTTHHRLTEEARREQGITPGMVRVSIGLEDTADLMTDLNGALASVR